MCIPQFTNLYPQFHPDLMKFQGRAKTHNTWVYRPGFEGLTDTLSHSLCCARSLYSLIYKSTLAQWPGRWGEGDRENSEGKNLSKNLNRLHSGKSLERAHLIEAALHAGVPISDLTPDDRLGCVPVYLPSPWRFWRPLKLTRSEPELLVFMPLPLSQDGGWAETFQWHAHRNWSHPPPSMMWMNFISVTWRKLPK